MSQDENVSDPERAGKLREELATVERRIAEQARADKLAAIPAECREQARRYGVDPVEWHENVWGPRQGKAAAESAKLAAIPEECKREARMRGIDPVLWHDRVWSRRTDV